jgi:hypothetical protein
VKAYADLGDLNEDKRIDIIGQQVMRGWRSVSFIVDDEPGKAERYIEKLQKKFPGVTVVERGIGPVPGTVWIKVKPPERLQLVLERVHPGNERHCFKLWACRGEGRGCNRNRFRETKVHCDDCVEARDEETIGQLIARMGRAN